MLDHYHQLTGRVAAGYHLSFSGQLNLSAGIGWGSRAPTVTEAYGYYLNNTYDKYDYIGNPHLKNESAVELNAAVEWHPFSGATIGVDGNLFLFSNYIIGQFETRLSPMTVGAEGVKVYGNLSHARVANVTLNAGYRLAHADCKLTLSYALGWDADGDPLPFIAPFSYTARLGYDWRRLRVEAELKGSVRQTDYAPKYGESLTPAYAIVGLSANYRLPLGSRLLTLKMGVENLLDKTYSTYADWNKIPQKGRNIYANITFEL